MTQNTYPHINTLTRDYLTTQEAAYYLNRSPQTLRRWASSNTLLKPVRIQGRLAWPLHGVKAILGGSK